ncbi:MAG TPA: SPOR domain-containing protein [Terracidiphilus sp.]
MRGYFNNDEPEIEEPDGLPGEREERGHDTELTLSTAAQLGVVFCLLLLCGLCFGAGYWVGHRGWPSALAAAANQPSAPTAAPDQEPLQGNGTLPKPSADAQLPPSQPLPNSDGTTPNGDSSQNPAPTEPPPSAEQPSTPANPPPTKPAGPAHSQAPPAQPAPAHTAPTPPRPAYPARANEPQPARASEPQGHPAAPPASSGYSTNPGQYAGQYMVQVAAVSHFEDANVLVNALRGRGFPAIAQRSSSDGLVHVRIGPFQTHEEAGRMAARLLGDGYNAMVQP